MKSNSKTKSKIPVIISVILSIITMLTAASRPASGAVGKAALFCAGIALPEGGVALVRRAADRSPGETENRTADTNRFFSLTGVVQTKKLSSTDDLVYTPADIAALIKKAQTAFAGQKKDGLIEEMTYGIKNASSVYKNVTVKNATATKSLNIEKVLKERQNKTGCFDHPHAYNRGLRNA